RIISVRGCVTEFGESKRREPDLSRCGNDVGQGSGNRELRDQGVQGNSIRRADGRQESFHAAEKAYALDRRARVLRSRSDMSSDTGEPAIRVRDDDPVGSAIRRNG